MNNKYQKLLDLDPETFDQDEKRGWRKLENTGRPDEAIEVLKIYLNLNQKKLRSGNPDEQELEKYMNFHLGQLIAVHQEANYPEAVKYIKDARVKGLIGWNYYVGGTIAFLENNKVELARNISGLERLEKKLGVGINNLDILLNFSKQLQSGKHSYKQAYKS